MRMVLLALIACGGTAATTPAPTSAALRANDDCGLRAPAPPPGYSPPEIVGIAVAKPQVCDHGAYMRIERAAGARKIGTRRTSQGFNEGCDAFPTDPHDATECPVISYRPFLNALAAELRAQGIEINGIGGGPCAKY